MLMELVEKKNQPIKTKVSFSLKEYEKMPEEVKALYKKNAEMHETKRRVYFLFDGDLINVRKRKYQNNN